MSKGDGLTSSGTCDCMVGVAFGASAKNCNAAVVAASGAEVDLSLPRKGVQGQRENRDESGAENVCGYNQAHLDARCTGTTENKQRQAG